MFTVGISVLSVTFPKITYTTVSVLVTILTLSDSFFDVKYVVFGVRISDTSGIFQFPVLSVVKLSINVAFICGQVISACRRKVCV